MTTTIELVGISGEELSSEAVQALSGCAAVVASSRHARFALERGLETIPIAPVSAMLDSLEKALGMGNVAVLASGDPLFFGVGRTLIKRFGAERINIHPALSSMQLACARFRIPWDDMKFISLHGRDAANCASAILLSQKTAIFTDSRNSPDYICRLILEKLSVAGDMETSSKITVHVAENLGHTDERLYVGNLEDIASTAFRPMNIMVTVHEDGWFRERFTETRIALGRNEHEISHSRGLITKDEVRAVTLHRLRLPADGCFWDIGAGSGSISIEASGLCPGLEIYSIEKNPEQQENIRKNIRKFGCWNINLINGQAPEALSGLPLPQRVFVGGSGGRLEDIIRFCCKKLAVNGRLVVNAILSQTARTAPVLMHEAGLDVSVVRISVERNQGQESGRKFNPITIITGIK